ncbi:MAG: prepilin-type N-terminal cleavage/methylation domain-containing protein [Clostridiales bacterium]|jgi:type II secretory pathway pseudopilin PulG|nr:prepilin-type N-terminal cleavage/methylation domain-containing protein [Clostridiales bacterium]
MTSKRLAGLTLIELVIVLALMAAFAGIGAGSLRAAERRSVTDSARVLAADIRYTQSMSMLEGRRWGVILDRANSAYRIVRTGPAETVKAVNLASGVRIWGNTNVSSIYYLPRGTVSGSGSIWLTRGRYWQKLTIVPSAGRVEIKPLVYSKDGRPPPDEES